MAETVVKNGKKKRRRLKRSVRKTLGALFLATALVVAAIPVDGLQAEESGTPSEGARADTNWTRANKKVTLKLNKEGTSGVDDVKVSNIPDFAPGDIIYTTGEGQFQFAYDYSATSGNKKVAVILGYQKGGSLPGGALTIPEYVDAYRNFSTDTSRGNYVAVNGNSWFLYYLREWEENKLDADGNIIYKKDEDGNDTDVPETVTKSEMTPCYSTSVEVWADKELYYNDGGLGSNKPVGQDTPAAPTDTNYVKILVSDGMELQRIHDAEVWYIGNQYVTAQNGNWEVAEDITNPSDGIFAGVTNIETLTVTGDKLCGVGNYAFYDCTNLKSIKLNNGLDTLGNFAFAECANMLAVDIDPLANLKVIGERAFYQIGRAHV